jgi:hypothetical protein
MKIINQVLVSGISSLDLYGPPVNLTVQKRERANNIWGAMLSMAALIGSLVLAAPVFNDYVHGTNPTVVENKVYGLTKTDFTSRSLYLSMSFYSQLPNPTVRGINAQNNNYTDIYRLKSLNISCPNCTSTSGSSKRLLQSASVTPTTAATSAQPAAIKRMALCNPAFYNNITIKGMNDVTSQGVLTIFSNYSYCLPDQIKGTVEYVNNGEQDTSFQITIPYSKTPVDFTTIPRNTLPAPDGLAGAINSPSVADLIATTSSNDLPEPTQDNHTPGDQPNPSGEPDMPDPYADNPDDFAPDEPAPDEPGGNNEGPGEDNGGDNVEPGGDNVEPGGDNPDVAPSGDNTDGGAVLPDNNAAPVDDNSSDGTRRRLTQKKELRKLDTTTTLTTASTSAIDTNLSDNQIKQAFSSFGSLYNLYKFPKLMLLSKDLELNPSMSSEIAKEIYVLNVLDYKDILQDTPQVFNVYLEQVTINIKKANFLTYTDVNVPVLRVNRIEVNKIDSLGNKGAYLSFRHMPEGRTYVVTFVTFTDFLAAFGGIYSTLNMVAAIIASFFGDVYLKTLLMNSVFKFIDYNPDGGYEMSNKFLVSNNNNNNNKNDNNNEKVIFN